MCHDGLRPKPFMELNVYMATDKAEEDGGALEV
jgi:hypothetical protein